MKEYICIYEERFIQTYTRKVKAISEGSAAVKFSNWLNGEECIHNEDDIVIICIDEIKEIESIN